MGVNNKGWPGAQRCTGPLAYSLILVERNSDVDHRIAKVIDTECLSGQEVYPIEAGHTTHN